MPAGEEVFQARDELLHFVVGSRTDNQADPPATIYQLYRREREQNCAVMPLPAPPSWQFLVFAINLSQT